MEEKVFSKRETSLLAKLCATILAAMELLPDDRSRRVIRSIYQDAIMSFLIDGYPAIAVMMETVMSETWSEIHEVKRAD